MKLFLLVWSLCSLASISFCQEESALMQMVSAEKSFAAYAGATGIAVAFVKFLSDSAKVFERGQILNGKEVWRERKTDSMELRFYAYGYVEAGGKTGNYLRVWKKDSDVWSIVLDAATY